MKKAIGFIEGPIFTTVALAIIYLICLVRSLISWDEGRDKMKELTGWNF